METASGSHKLEQLIRELNDPRNQAAPERIDTIQRQIQRLQRDFSAWQIGLDFLQHSEAQIRFYGALTLTIKINADWDKDKIAEDRAIVNQLLERLLTSYILLAAIPDANFVLQKLCTTLVAFFQKDDSAWALPVRHVLACSLAGSYIDQANIPPASILFDSTSNVSVHQLKAVLMFCLTLVEETAAVAATAKRHQIEVRKSNNARDAWKVIHHCVQVVVNSMGISSTEIQLQPPIYLDQQEAVDIAALTIRLIPYWTDYVKFKPQNDSLNTSPELDHFKISIEAMLCFLKEAQLSSMVVQSYTLVVQNHYRLLKQSMPHSAEYVVTSESAATWVKQLLSGDFDSEPMAYMDLLETLMNQADVTSFNYLENLTYRTALDQTKQLLHCDGIAGVEDTACQVALEIITSVTEGFGDWDDHGAFGSSIRTLVAEACKDCLIKIRLPAAQMNPGHQAWDNDDRTKFQDFRYDVQDFLQNAFTILGPVLIQEIVQRIIGESRNVDWSGFESNLFGLVSFSDTFNVDPEQFDQYLGAVFGCDAWLSALANNASTPERVRKIMIKLVGENAGYLERHPDTLVPCLNFLFESLHIKTSATSASRAIFTLCDIQRIALTEALPQFMTSLNTISDLDTDAKSRIFGGVSAIVQALQTEDSKCSPLAQILNIVQADVDSLLTSSAELAELRTKATDIVWTLATIGKGLRNPNDPAEDVPTALSHEIDFWTHGPGSSVQQHALAIYDTLRQKINGDEDSLFIEATCDFIKSAFTEENPSPFKFTPGVVLQVLYSLVKLKSPQPSIVLACASSYLASLNPDDNQNIFSALFTAVLKQCQELKHQSIDGKMFHTDFCAASLDFFARFLPRWTIVWLSLSDSKESAEIMIDLGLILIEDQDTLARRTAATFFTALFEASGSSKVRSNQDAADNFTAIMQAHVARILASIIRLIGGECARSELESLTDPLKRLVQRQPLMANRFIKEAVKEENGVLTQSALEATKPEQRARFASQVEMLRGSRKTNEVVREFWIACKGSSFGYVT